MTGDKLVTAPAGTTLDEAEQIMAKHRIEKLPVVDGAGKLLGLITVKDILKRRQYPLAAKDELGRLLVAAAITQRPELFRAGLSLVPLTDMIRYHRFRIAKLWVPEYGDPEKASDFAFLYKYSPYHHVREGVHYPAMLFTTAESDSRVDPMHARKMTARMQEVQQDPARPILIRVETKAGHGAGKPVSTLADELADELSFLLHELGLAL